MLNNNLSGPDAATARSNGPPPTVPPEPAPAKAPKKAVPKPHTEVAVSAADLVFDGERRLWKDKRPVIYTRDPILVQVHQALTDLKNAVWHDEDDHRLIVMSGDRSRAVRISKPILRGLMELFSAFVDTTDDGLIPKRPPGAVLDAVFERGDYPEVNKFRGVRRMAYIGRDGLVRTDVGYDCATGIFHAPATGQQPIEIPAAITRGDALAEVDFINREVFGDFPMNDVSRSVCWSGMMSTAARPAIGPVPAHLTDAPVAGSGKTMLNEIIASIGLGEIVSPVAHRPDPAEFSKTLLSKLLLKQGAIVFDNVIGPWGAPELDAMLTSRTGRMLVRMLGELRGVDVWCESVVFASGNGLQVTGDQGRRVLWARLDPQMEHPETRTGFRHEDLPAYVRANLARLHRSVLIIWEAFRQAGRTRSDRPLLGSFEGWSMHVRDLLLWLGMADPCDSRVLTAERDPDREFLTTFLPALERLDATKIGLTIGQIADAAVIPKNNDLAGALVEFRTPAGHYNARQLGKRLAYFRGRIIGGRRLCSPERLRHGQRAWIVERMATVQAEQPS